MADFFFFTDVESLTTNQASGDQFGPVSGTQYNLDSWHTVIVDAKAYAMCDSLVLIQENSDGNLNVILKPLVFPDFNIGRIEYIIYKGLKLSSLINGNEVAKRTNNDLCENLWLRQEKTDANSGSTPSNPLKKYLGVDYTADAADEFLVADDKSIESVFFKEGDVQLATIKGGDLIGQFVGGATKCGIQIIVERVGFYPSMELARKGKHVLNITEPLGNTQYQQFLHYHKKEEILNYIDPVSFFGMFKQSSNKFIIKSSAGATIEIPTLIQKFQNKNRIYLDIRNEYDKSFNYYHLYGSSIGYSSDSSVDASTITSYDFYTQNASSTGNYGTWPIFIIEGQPVQTLSENQLHGKMFLKIADDNDVLKSVYFMNGSLNGISRENKFEYEFDSTNYIAELSSWIYNDGNDKFGSSYILLKLSYNRSKEFSGLFTPGISVLDHLFPIDRLIINLDRGPIDIAVKVYQNGSVIEQIEYPELYGDIYGAFIGIAKDSNTYVLFASPNNDIGFIKDQNIKPNSSFISGLFKEKVDFFHLLTELSENIDFEMNDFELDSVTYSSLRFLKSAGDPMNNTIESSLFDAIQITHTEYNQLVTLMNSSGFITDFGVYLSTKADSSFYQNIPDFCFRQTQLTLEGLEFVPESNNSQIQKKIVNTNLIINTIISNTL